MHHPDHSCDIPISFGDCDPAQIVFYPNYFRWFDQCFHGFVQARFGGHQALREALGARGVGLVDAGAQFLAPATAGDVMRLDMRIGDWTPLTLRLDYVGHIGDRRILTGHEQRAVFMDRDGEPGAPHGGQLRAGKTDRLRALLTPDQG